MKKGWETKTLGEVCRFIDYRGRTPNKTDSGLRLITAKNVKMGFLQTTPREFVNPNSYEKWMTRGIPKIGDVLFTTEAPLANVAQLDTDEKVVFAQRIIVLQPIGRDIDRTYLKYLLLSDGTQKRIHEKGTGATVKGIKASLLKTIPISFPPLPEQRQIVSILDESFEAISKAKENAEKNLRNARELFQSYLQGVFTKGGEDWEEKKLGEVCEFIGGSQPPKDVFEKTNSPENIRLIQIRDYKSDKNVVYIPRDCAKRLCNETDVMIGRYGPPLFQILRGLNGAYNVALMKAKPNEERLTKDFLYYFLQNPSILKYVIYHSQRAAGQIGLTKETLEPYPIAIPSLDKQRQVVQTIESLSAETKKLEAIYQKKLNNLEEFKKSLLQKAFNGELAESV